MAENHINKNSTKERKETMLSNARREDRDYLNFLEELLTIGYLGQSEKKEITRLVIDGGEEALSLRQKNIFEKDILGTYVTKNCCYCDHEIPWSEMLEAYDNGGSCAWCAKLMINDD